MKLAGQEYNGNRRVYTHDDLNDNYSHFKQDNIVLKDT